MIKILIRSSKGGTGKSTITEAIRQVLEADVIDMDHQKTLTMASRLTTRFLLLASNPNSIKSSISSVLVFTLPFLFLSSFMPFLSSC